GWLIQRAGVQVPQRAICFSRLHTERLRAEGLRGEVTALPGEYAGPLTVRPMHDPEPMIVFAGRHIPEKQVAAIPPAVLRARMDLPELRAMILGDGPEREAVAQLTAELGLSDVIELPGFVAGDTVEHALERALCMVLPSRRE